MEGIAIAARSKTIMILMLARAQITVEHQAVAAGARQRKPDRCWGCDAELVGGCCPNSEERDLSLRCRVHWPAGDG